MKITRFRRRFLLAMTALVVGPILAPANEPEDEGAGAREPMDALSFLIGEWSGSGWHDHGDHTNRFVQTVQARSELDGEVILVEQKAVDENDRQRVIHHSLAVLSWDPQAGFVSSSWLPGGRRRVASLVVDDGAYSWLAPDGRFTVWVGADGRYRMMGHSPRGETFFAMDLQPLSGPSLPASSPRARQGGEPIERLAERYTAAWNSGDPASVAAFYAPAAALTVNTGPPARGREAVTEVARGFMSAFPDLELSFDGLDIVGDRVHYRWTFAGANTGPGGTGRRVRFSGYEAWRIGGDGLIADSLGHFDADEYARQLEHGVGGERDR